MQSLLATHTRAPLHNTTAAHATNLFSLLGGDLTSTPGDDVQVDEGIDDEEEVHRGNTQQVQQTWNNTLKLLRMHTRRDEEGA